MKIAVIVSPDPVPHRHGIVTEKILEIQQEILLINRHEREHIANGEIRQPHASCVYCQRRGRQKKAGTLNEIERRVDLSGKSGCVLVPRTWSGKRVRIILVDEDDN
jgi:hypothetical protein